MSYYKETSPHHFEEIPWGNEYRGEAINILLEATLRDWTKKAAAIALALDRQEDISETFLGQVPPQEIEAVMSSLRNGDIIPTTKPSFNTIDDGRPGSPPFRQNRINGLRPGPDEARLYLGEPEIHATTRDKLTAKRYVFPFALLTTTPLQITEWRNSKKPLLAYYRQSIIMTIKLKNKSYTQPYLQVSPLTETNLIWSPDSYESLQVKNPTFPASYRTYDQMWTAAQLLE